jgi:DNA-directed RNA polymerase specialized sigma24 family protein
LPAATTPSDAELIARARLGDARAHNQLRARHVDAARRLAHGLGRPGPPADGIVDEAFVVLGREIERGRGPDIGYRTALLATLVRLAGAAADAPARSASRLAGAYRSLPEPSQAVLWYADIERLPSAEIETYLGVGPTDLAALDYRAKARLRQAYLTEARHTKPSDSCGPALDRIEAYLLGALSGGETVKVERHLSGCATCRDIAVDLGDLRAALVAAVAPDVLGPARAAYLADRSVVADEATGRPLDPAARHGRRRRNRRNRSRAGVGLALVTVLLVGLLTWIVYGASTAAVSGAEVAAEAERRGEVDPAEPAAEAEGTTTGTADAGTTTGTPADPSDDDGPAPGDEAPAGSATSGTGTGAESNASPPATGAGPTPPTPSSSTPAPASSPPAPTTAPPAPAPSAPPATAPAPPATAPAVINSPAIVAAPPPPTPTADLSLAISGAHHGSWSVTVVVRNAGPQAAAAPTVEFVLRRLPRGVPAGCSPNPARLTMACSVGTLAANRQVHVDVVVVDGTDVVGVRVLSSTTDPNQANNLWTILPGSISLDRPLSGLS